MTRSRPLGGGDVRNIPNGKIAVWNSTLDDRLHADVAALVVRVAALETALAEQAVRLEQLHAGRGPRDEADVQLFAAIAEAATGLPFHAADVMRRAAFVPALNAALRAADISSARQLGKLLARLEATTANGVRLYRGRLRGGAYYWQLVQQVSQV